MNKLRSLVLGIVFFWFFGGGIGHFISPEFFTHIMPPYLPYHLELVYISGIFEILGAVGILIPRFRSMAGYGLFALVICVTPANIHMWIHPELFPEVPAIFLSVRLIIQAILLYGIWWSTRSNTSPIMQTA